jgi:protein-S-isoprenylcysteine O-methyltransferase Ste14
MDAMPERTVGWMFVAAQAALLAALILLPGRDDFPVPSWVRSAADAAFWLGLALIVLAAAFLGRSLTATPVPLDRAELRTTGPYRWARHPIYSGVILVVIAISLRSGSVITVAIGALTLAFFVVKSTWEERRLTERFPEYPDYAARTGRFLPGW